VIEVQVRGGNLEKAMRVLKKKVMKEGIVKELRRRQYFQKPSEIKREKKKEGIKNYKKKMAKLNREL
jgi:small subunit ribosomal protein S21